MKCIPAALILIIALAAPAMAQDKNLAIQVLQEINLARTQPRVYAGLLREFRSRFQKNFYILPGSTTRMQTSEGVKAVNEAITTLNRLKPLPPLNWSDGLAAAAYELSQDQGDSGDTGHSGRRSHGMQERIERHGKWEGQIGENIGYGLNDPRLLTMQLIIDDGVPDRGHRKNTFSKAFTTAGIACGPHPHYGSMCVIDFAGGFKE